MDNIQFNNSTVSFISTDENKLTNTVLLINQSISRYIMLVVWLIGNIGSMLNSIIFFQPALRKSPCALYFIASNISQFLIHNFALLTRILLSGFGIKAVYFQIWYCKFRNYFFYVFLATSRYYTILASVDRYLASSRNALRRQWSSSKIALRIIIINIIFWCLIYIHVIIFYEIYPNNCLPRKGIYQMIFSIYILIDNGILPLSFMITFGLLTLKNVRKTKRIVIPTISIINANQLNRRNKIKKKDSQFIKMLLNQIFLYIIFDVFNPCFLLYQTITIDIQKSQLLLEIELLLNNMSYFLIYIGFSLTFFLNIYSSSLFRNEFKRFIQRKIFHQQITQTSSTVPTNRTV